MAKKKSVKKTVVIKPNAGTGCPKGYILNSKGVCVEDPG